MYRKVKVVHFSRPFLVHFFATLDTTIKLKIINRLTWDIYIGIQDLIHY